MFKNDGIKKTTGKSKNITWWKNLSVNLILLVLVLFLLVLSLFLGRFYTSPYTVILILVSGISEGIGDLLQPIASHFGVSLTFFWFIHSNWDPTMTPVIWDIRLPEALGVILVGSGLAVSGASYQAVFRNPLVSPDILGISSGAALGAALAILYSSDYSYWVPVTAFVFSVLTVAATYAISRILKKGNATLMLILSGIVVASMLSALLSMLIAIIASITDGDPTKTKLQDIIFWLMGSFQGISYTALLYVTPVILGCMFILVLLRWRLNVLSMGDEEARALGIDVGRLRGVVILCATLITAACICISGSIGWVGLVIPHFARMVVGPDHKVMLITSILMGASFMLVVDTICRDLFPVLIPVSIVTSLAGVPIFLYLLKRSKHTWS
jgi:iron complex transport system permease protein